MEAERSRLSPTANGNTLNGGGNGLAGILEHHQVVAPGNFHDSRHIGNIARVMDCQDGFGLWSNGGFNLGRVNNKSLFAIHKHRLGSTCYDGSYGCKKSGRSRNDFGSASNSADFHGKN